MADIGIREVAALAGVSVSTVSNAINRPETVSRAAAAKVAKAIEHLSYVPNTAARQLRAGRSDALGMTVINITNPFFSEMVLGAEDAAERAGYSIIVGNSYDSEDREGRYLDLFDRQRLDGVLIAPVSGEPPALDRFTRRDVPVVYLDRVDSTGEFLSVSLNDVLGGRLAAEHLLAGGSRHLAFIGGPFRRTQMRERFEGFEAAVLAAGARLTVIETQTLNPSLGRELGDQLLRMPDAERPQAVFAGNDHLAVGILQTMLAHGVRVPQEISIIGYDDIEFAATAAVPLSSVRQPAYDMGARAAELLIAQLNEPGPVMTARFEPRLVVRSSTLPPL